MKLSDEFNFKKSSKSFEHLKSMVDLLLKEPDKRKYSFNKLTKIIAEKEGVLEQTVYMGIFRALTIALEKENPKYPNITPDLCSKEIVIRFVEICQQEGREF